MPSGTVYVPSRLLRTTSELLVNMNQRAFAVFIGIVIGLKCRKCLELYDFFTVSMSVLMHNEVYSSFCIYNVTYMLQMSSDM